VFLDCVGTQIGTLYAHLAGRKPNDTECQTFRDAFHAGQSLEHRIEELVRAARAVCEAWPALDAHRDTLGTILESVSFVLAEPQLLFRYDNNFSNMLIRDGELVGLVDFEQCYLGTETILLGALLDTVPEIYPLFPRRPRWPAIRSGYEAQRGAEIDAQWFHHIVAMAMLNHWYRIADTHSRLGTIEEYVIRFESRFPVLRAMYAAGQ
jgi:hypothetical protein